MGSEVTDIGLAAILHRRAELSPHRPVITYLGETQSYGAFSEKTKKLAGAFVASGLKPGDRIGYLGLNHAAFLETLYGVATMGGIFVPLNFRLTGQELIFIINDAGIDTLLIDDDLLSVIEPVRGDLCCKTYISIDSPNGDDVYYPDFIESHGPIGESYRAAEDDTVVIMYTSGTTGLPKGAMLTHGNLYWNFLNAIMSAGFLEEDVTLVAAPLFHIGGLNVLTLGTLNVGGHAVIMRSFDPKQALELITSEKVTTMFGAPAMYQFMAQQDLFTETDLSRIRSFFVGAAPVPAPLIEIYNARDVTFAQGYGMTELSPLALILSGEFSASKVGSCGKPPMFCDVRIVDTNNQPVPAGERGEVVVRGPNVMKGYWNRPDATAETIDEGGWLHSGDIAYVDEDGFFFICDRVKDMIISGGENVYPAEVESVLTGHEAIAEVAVIGLKDDKWGEAVTAVAALQEGGSLTLAELRDYAGEHLARYKLPLHLHIVDELPRNAAGKVLKFELREQFLVE